jgi:CCR4-NOT transcription complex subunit 1
MPGPVLTESLASTFKILEANPENQQIRQQFSKEVEDKANSYFQQIYNQPPHPTMSIDEVLEMLKRFKRQ